MAAEFEVINGELKVIFWYQAETQRVQDTALDAAHYLYDAHKWARELHLDQVGAPVPFDDLTNSQNLRILDVAVKRYLLKCAESFYVTDAEETARETAEGELDDRYLPNEVAAVEMDR